MAAEEGSQAFCLLTKIVDALDPEGFTFQEVHEACNALTRRKTGEGNYTREDLKILQHEGFLEYDSKSRLFRVVIYP